MADKEPKHCWEFHNCAEATRKKCPAYLNPEEKCWVVASSYAGKGCPNTKRAGIIYCVTECKWFKKHNPKIFE